MGLDPKGYYTPTTQAHHGQGRLHAQLHPDEYELDELISIILQRYNLERFYLPPACSYTHLRGWLTQIADGRKTFRPNHKLRRVPYKVWHANGRFPKRLTCLMECIHCGVLQCSEKTGTGKGKVFDHYFAYPEADGGPPADPGAWKQIPPWCVRPGLYWEPGGPDTPLRGREFWIGGDEDEDEGEP